MSTAFHPETNGSSERRNQTVQQIMRSVVQADQKDWVKHLPMIEFALNSATNVSTGFAPFELTGTMPRIMYTAADGTAPQGVEQVAEEIWENLLIMYDMILASQVDQTDQANRKHRPEGMSDDQHWTIKVGDLTYLSTKNLNMPKGRASKLLPKYIGPYKVLSAEPAILVYKLDLPKEQREQWIHPKFHVKLLRKYIPNDAKLFPHRETHAFYDFGESKDVKLVVSEITNHRWVGQNLDLEVQWEHSDTTWETAENCEELEALDRYLELQGVSNPQELTTHDRIYEVPKEKAKQKSRAKAAKK